MIQLRIKDETDLYNRLDPTQTKLNPLVYSYLKSFCSYSEYKDHLHDTLQVISDGPVDADKLKRTIQAAVQNDLAEFDMQIDINKQRAVRSYIVGIICSVIGVTLTLLLDQVLLSIISFYGTLSISEAVSIQTKLNPDIKRMKRHLDPFVDFNLEVIRE